MELLRSFVVVRDQGGISRAADILARSQPAVSLQIKRLEALLDQQLFIRSTQKFELTDAGVVLLEYARRILEINDEALARFSAQSIRGRVRLGLPSEFAATLMPRIIGRFTRQYPDVSLEVSSELSVSLAKRFKNKHYDLVLTLRDKPNKERSDFLNRDELVWVGGGKKLEFPDDVIPLIVAPQGCMYRARAMNALKKAKVKSKIVYTIPDLSGIEVAIQEGLGVTVLAKNTVPGSLHLIKGHSQLPVLGEIGISLLFDEKTASAATQRLASYLHSNLR